MTPEQLKTVEQIIKIMPEIHTWAEFKQEQKNLSEAEMLDIMTEITAFLCAMVELKAITINDKT